jgi:hypothetical protein
MKCGCVFREIVKRKLATRKDKIKIIKTKRGGYATCLPLALSVSREERCEVLACFHVVVKMYRYSLEERVLIVKIYWIKNCQRRFNSLVAETRRQNADLHRERQAGCVTVSFRLDYLYLILSFSVANFLFANSINTQPHFITGMKCKCIALLFFL